MQKILDKVHVAWLGLAGLWALCFLVGLLADIVVRPSGYPYGPPRGAWLQTLFGLLFIAYLIGGFVLGKIYNRHTARFTLASFRREDAGGVATFHITPAPRHFGFWVIGMFGAFLLFSLPAMLTGSGVGFFFTLVILGMLYLLALQPKMWRPIPPHSFSMDSRSVTAGGRTVPLAEVRVFMVKTGLPGKAEKQAERGMTGSYVQAPQTTTVYATTGNPLAAQGMVAAQQLGVGASAAAGEGIAEVANRYYYEMKARSWQVEGVATGGPIVVARGLDPHTAQNLLEQMQAVAGNPTAPAAASAATGMPQETA